MHAALRCLTFATRLHPTHSSLPPTPPSRAATVSVVSRTVTVKGPRGTLTRAFKAVNFAAEVRGKRSMKIDMWFSNRLQKACLRTICTHIENMISGVTKGFTYKMRFAYAHFPINVTCVKDAAGQLVEVRNFLGEKRLRRIRLHEGVSVAKTDNVKDEIVLTGNDLEKVAGSAQMIHECVLVHNKDIRKFLDGIYVRFVRQGGRQARGGSVGGGAPRSARMERERPVRGRLDGGGRPTHREEAEQLRPRRRERAPERIMISRPPTFCPTPILSLAVRRASRARLSA